MPSSTLKYLSSYPDSLQAQVQQLLDQDKLGDMLLKKYPRSHGVRTDKALYDYVMRLKTSFCAARSRCRRWRLTTGCR